MARNLLILIAGHYCVDHGEPADPRGDRRDPSGVGRRGAGGACGPARLHYRHLAVLSDGTVEPERLARLMAAVEHLDAYGWELVTLSPSTDARRLIAILRRRSLG